MADYTRVALLLCTIISSSAVAVGFGAGGRFRYGLLESLMSIWMWAVVVVPGLYGQLLLYRLDKLQSGMAHKMSGMSPVANAPLVSTSIVLDQLKADVREQKSSSIHLQSDIRTLKAEIRECNGSIEKLRDDLSRMREELSLHLTKPQRRYRLNKSLPTGIDQILDQLEAFDMKEAAEAVAIAAKETTKTAYCPSKTASVADISDEAESDKEANGQSDTPEPTDLENARGKRSIKVFPTEGGGRLVMVTQDFKATTADELEQELADFLTLTQE